MSAKRVTGIPIRFANAALRELDEIWEWNSSRYDREHAFRYLDFLNDRIESLGRDDKQGHAVDVRPEFRYVLIRRKAQGYGHVVVYQVRDDHIFILHVFHTSQDWRQQLIKVSSE